MRRLTTYVLLIALAAGLSTMTAGTAVSQENPRDCFDRTNRSEREDVLDRVNRERQKNNLPPFACDAMLSAIAQNHALDMERRGYFSHTSPEGKDVFDRLDEAGIAYTRACENIAWNLQGPRSVVKLWMGSPGHRKNILGDFTKVGIGSYRGYYVLMPVRE